MSSFLDEEDCRREEIAESKALEVRRLDVAKPAIMFLAIEYILIWITFHGANSAQQHLMKPGLQSHITFPFS